MKKLFLFLLAGMMLSTGCIEIVESVKVNPDRSGSFSFYLDVGKLDLFDNKVSGKYINTELLEDIKQQPALAYNKLVDVKGISQVKQLNSNGKYGISFHFKNPSALNKALYNLGGKKKRCFMPKVLKVGNRKFVQRDVGPVVRKYFEEMGDNKPSRMLLQFIEYSQTYELPGQIKSSENPRSKFVNGTSKASSKYTLLEILTTEISLSEKLIYKK